MSLVHRFTPSDWEEGVVQCPQLVLVELRGHEPEGTAVLEGLAAEFQGDVKVGVLDLTPILTFSQISWFQEEPVLACFMEGRPIRSTTGKDRVLRMTDWLSLVRQWSPCFWADHHAGV